LAAWEGAIAAKHIGALASSPGMFGLDLGVWNERGGIYIYTIDIHTIYMHIIWLYMYVCMYVYIYLWKFDGYAWSSLLNMTISWAYSPVWTDTSCFGVCCNHVRCN
jgi:hypothetical protein